jgi:hypothetical protein
MSTEKNDLVPSIKLLSLEGRQLTSQLPDCVVSSLFKAPVMGLQE